MPLRRPPQLESWVGIGRNGKYLAFASEVEALKCAFAHALTFWAGVARASSDLSMHSQSAEPDGLIDRAMHGAICDLEVRVKYLGEALQYLFSRPPENERVAIDVDKLIIVDDQADEPFPGRGPIGGAP